MVDAALVEDVVVVEATAVGVDSVVVVVNVVDGNVNSPVFLVVNVVSIVGKKVVVVAVVVVVVIVVLVVVVVIVVNVVVCAVAELEVVLVDVVISVVEELSSVLVEDMNTEELDVVEVVVVLEIAPTCSRIAHC